MKNLSLALNAVLILAVGFLYYKQFSGTKTEAAAIAEPGDSTSTPAPTPPVLSELPKDVPVVFVNADSLFAGYEMAKKAKVVLEGKVSSYQRTYQTKVDQFQQEYKDYMEKAGAGAYTKEQGMVIEEGLQKKRDDIMQMEQNQDKMMGEMDNANVDVQKNIYNFLTRFNKEHGYYCAMAYTTTGGGVLGIKDSLDVTNQVLVGLNAEYKAKK